jgi:hypothetical protein
VTLLLTLLILAVVGLVEEIAELRGALGRTSRHEATQPHEAPRWRREPGEDDDLGDRSAFLPPTGTHDERGGR